MTPRESPLVPISWGELLDKIGILEIKRERIGDPAARANVLHELRLLEREAEPVAADPGIAALRARLKSINEMLWQIEDDIRVKERLGDFGAGFVALARSVYQRNDERAAIKREINRLLDSALVEEKSYASAHSPFLLAGGQPPP
jgi:3-methyladenine DNA glycosylase/8-oxoguanine DNA glycosylase